MYENNLINFSPPNKHLSLAKDLNSFNYKFGCIYFIRVLH